VLVPVDTFSFCFKPPPATRNDKSTHYDQLIQEGDTVQLTLAGQALATGYIDSVDVTLDSDQGVRMTVNGRDLMGFLEDNDAVNFDSTIIYTQDVKLSAVMNKLLNDTRINSYELVNAQDFTNLFATIPGESKLAALQRFLEMPNYLAWMSPVGKVRVGSPSFNAVPGGTIGVRVLEKQRISNVLSMNVHRASGQIPNAVLSVWTGNEQIQTIVANAVKVNQAKGPNRLYKNGHKVMRCISTSAPNATDVQQLSRTALLAAAGSSQFLDTLAARELARENVNELLVTTSVIGHLNDNGDPYTSDQTYNIAFDAAGVDETMYLYGVEYLLSEDTGQQTQLQFCKLNTIVAGGPVTQT
jgi:prophage tail gpP-like protein